MITFDDILDAARVIEGVAHRTPVMRSSTLDAMTGYEVFLKCENFQRIGAFKIRGAFNALSRLNPEERARGVVAASSGNHAQAIACSARMLGMPALIVMPEDAPATKLAATRGYGAEVVTYDRYTENRDAICAQWSEERGMTIVPPFNHPHVIAGQGTAALELMQEIEALDALVAPLGGGGLLAGTALAARGLSPEVRVYGAEPAAGNDGQQSFRAGHIIEIAPPRTIADGAQTLALGSLTYPIIREHVTDIVTVDDAALVRAMRFFAERMKLWVEPTGCLGLAALLEGALVLPPGTRVGVVISGGNVDASTFARLMESAA